MISFGENSSFGAFMRQGQTADMKTDTNYFFNFIIFARKLIPD